MTKPAILNPRPSYFLALLGGLVGMILLSAMVYLAPVFGFPFVDIAHLIGGIFSPNPVIAFWLGFWLFFLGGNLFIAPLLIYLWPTLPGSGVGFTGAIVKGVLSGFILWVVSGLLIPLAGLINQLPSLLNPGLFGINAGPLAILGILLGTLAFSLAVTLIAASAQGIEPIETIGWEGIGKADVREIILNREGIEMPEEAIGRNVP